MKNNEASMTYEAAVAELTDFCTREADLMPVILTEQYPFRVTFVPDNQITMFDTDNVDENGEVNELIVTVGLETTVNSTLKFNMETTTLKKIIRMTEKLGALYYHAFREAAGDLRPSTVLHNDDLGEEAEE